MLAGTAVTMRLGGSESRSGFVHAEDFLNTLSNGVTLTDRLLRLDQDERRKEYRRQDFVPLEKIPTWRQDNRCESGCSSSTSLPSCSGSCLLTPFNFGVLPIRMKQSSQHEPQSDDKESKSA